MTKVTSVDISTTNLQSNNQIQTSFSLDGVSVNSMNVSDKLLTNMAVATSRAKAELLKHGYIAKRVSISTYHIDNIELGHIISIDSILYFIESIKEVVKGVEASMVIVGVRYER